LTLPDADIIEQHRSQGIYSTKGPYLREILRPNEASRAGGPFIRFVNCDRVLFEYYVLRHRCQHVGPCLSDCDVATMDCFQSCCANCRVRSRLALGFVGREWNCSYGDSSAVNTGAGLLAMLHKGGRRHHPHGCDLGRLHPGNKSCSRDLRRDWPHAVHHFVSCKQHAVLVRSCSDGPGQPSHGTSENDSQVSCHAHPLGIPTLTRAGLMGGRPATEGARCTARHAARVDCPLASGASDARVVCRFTDGLLVWRPLNKFGHSSPGSGTMYEVDLKQYGGHVHVGEGHNRW
jgi:hypothetical protein